MSLFKRLLFDWNSERKRYVVFLVEGSDGNSGSIGCKSAYNSKLFRTGLPVPPEFTITTAGSREFFETGYISAEFTMRYRKALCELETQADKKFGIASPDTSYWPRKLPLLLNIEADCALPLGRTPRVVDVGMNDTIAAYLSRTVESVIPALRIYASFLRSFGHLVFSVAEIEFDRILSAACAESGVERAAQLDAEGWERVVAAFKRLAPAPQDPYEQLQAAIEAVYGCWSGHYTEEVRAQADAGISVRVQCAVHGSVGKQDSGSGLLQLRGMKEPVVHFLPGGEVEDLAAAMAEQIPAVMSLQGMLAWNAAVAEALEETIRMLQRDVPPGTVRQEALEFVVEAGVVYVTSVH